MVDPIIFQWLVALIVGCFLILAGVAAIHLIGRFNLNATPNVQIILAALLPWALKAIIAGELIASEELDQFNRELSGLDKAEIAKSLYNLLPRTIVINGKPYDISFIKNIITLQMFSDFIKTNFDEVQALIISARDYLRKQIPAPDPSSTLRTVSSDSAATSQAFGAFDETQAAA